MDDKHRSATIADVTITFLAPEERLYPKDCYRIEQDGGKQWTATSQEVWDFLNDLETVLRAHRRSEQP